MGSHRFSRLWMRNPTTRRITKKRLINKEVTKMNFSFPKGRILAAILAGTAIAPLPALANTELRLGAAAADIGNLDPHYAASTTDRTLVAWVFGGLVRFAP